MRLICLTGGATRLYSTSEPTTLVGNATLQEGYPQGTTWDLKVGPTVTELMVQLPVQSSLQREILVTVAATGHGC